MNLLRLVILLAAALRIASLRNRPLIVPQEPPRQRLIKISDIVGATASVLLIISVVIVVVNLYGRYLSATASASPSGDAGSAQLFFSVPDINAYLHVNVKSKTWRETEYTYSIQANSTGGVDQFGFALVLAGAARAETKYPDGKVMRTVNGCWVSIYPQPDLCYEDEISPDRGLKLSESREKVQVIHGTVTHAALTFFRFTVHTNSTPTTTAGARTYFALPGIGTTYTPPQLRSQVGIDVGRSRVYRVPSNLDIRVDFGDLALGQRPEGIYPEPTPAGSLSWSERDASLLRARGSWIDVNVEGRHQQALFLIGILTSVVLAIFLATTRYLYHLVKEVALRRTQKAADSHVQCGAQLTDPRR